MKIVKQFLRQPIKTVSGILLMALAAMSVCIGVGQMAATETTAKMLEDSFSTVVIQSPIAQTVQYPFESHVSIRNSDDLNEWVQKVAQEHPEIVKQISNPGLASAHIPELNPVGYYQQEYESTMGAMASLQPEPFGAPWSCAMLEITLDDVSSPVEQKTSYSVEEPKYPWHFNSLEEYKAYAQTSEKKVLTTGYTIELKGTILQVLSLQEQFKDPTGMWVRMQYTVPTLEEAQAFIETLKLGERYLIYGMDYYDADWQLRISLKQRLEVTIDSFDMTKMRPLTEREIELYRQNNVGFVPEMIYNGIPLYEYDYAMVNTVTLTLPSAYDLIQYEDIRDESGTLQEIQEISRRTITDENGMDQTVSIQTFDEYYQTPNICLLEGSAEDFLTSEPGKDWAEMLRQAQINNHAFPVVGVDELKYVARFADESAQILEGRDFTDEELTAGARVCIISQELAAANGLRVGDRIYPNFYNADENLPYQDALAENNGIINPTASFYCATTPLLGTECFTIVGIYGCDEPWTEIQNAYHMGNMGDDLGHYAFTPNVIFAPKASIPSQMQYHNKCFFESVILHNGMIEEFEDLAKRSGYSGQFLLFDQGYTEIAGNFHDYHQVSQQALRVSLAVYGVILLLFLLLFPGSQRNHIKLMERLGAGPGKRRVYLFACCFAILLPATVLGVGIGMLFWNQIVGAMLDTVEGTTLTLKADFCVIAAVAGMQLLLALLLSIPVSVWTARSQNLSARR